MQCLSKLMHFNNSGHCSHRGRVKGRSHLANYQYLTKLVDVLLCYRHTAPFSAPWCGQQVFFRNPIPRLPGRLSQLCNRKWGPIPWHQLCLGFQGKQYSYYIEFPYKWLSSGVCLGSKQFCQRCLKKDLNCIHFTEKSGRCFESV